MTTPAQITMKLLYKGSAFKSGLPKSLKPFFFKTFVTTAVTIILQCLLTVHLMNWGGAEAAHVTSAPMQTTIIYCAPRENIV